MVHVLGCGVHQKDCDPCLALKKVCGNVNKCLHMMSEVHLIVC